MSGTHAHLVPGLVQDLMLVGAPPPPLLHQISWQGRSCHIWHAPLSRAWPRSRLDAGETYAPHPSPHHFY